MRDDMSSKSDANDAVRPILDAAQLAARELKTLRDRLSFDTRHSFRTPLTVIDGTARRLERNAETLSPDEVRARVHVIRATVEKMVEIVERSIEMSELASCVQDRPPDTSDLGELSQALIREYKTANPRLRFVSWAENIEGLEVIDRRVMDLILDKLFTIGAEIVQERGRLDFVSWSDGEDVTMSLKAVFEARSLIDVDAINSRLNEDDKQRLTLLCAGAELKLIRLLIEENGGELNVDRDSDRVEFELHLPIKNDGTPNELRLIRSKNSNTDR